VSFLIVRVRHSVADGADLVAYGGSVRDTFVVAVVEPVDAAALGSSVERPISGA
jgi:hypothetical protein